MAALMNKTVSNDNKPTRKVRVLNLNIDEKPERIVYTLSNHREREKLIKTCEKFIRGSDEYRELIKFIKNEMHMDRCYVNPAVCSANGKKYSIEIHHEPFTLFDIVDIEIMRREAESEPLSIMGIAESVMSIHYDGLVGLIPLSKTQHELVDHNKIFIPLQHIYQDYYGYYETYKDIIDNADHIKKKLDAKVLLSLKCGDVQSAVNEPEYVYIDVQGFKVLEVPEEWKSVIASSRIDLANIEREEEKAQKKLDKSKKATASEIKIDMT